MSKMNEASFPISGRKEFPAAEEYELEAALLLQEGHAERIRLSGRMGGWSEFYRLARVFRRLARRKRWSEETTRFGRQRTA